MKRFIKKRTFQKEMLKEELMNIVKTQRESITKKDKGIPRENTIKINSSFCTVISGIRRCGKST